MGYIAADELVVRPVLRHILVHDFEQFLVADSGIPPGMHGTNLFVAELDARSAITLCQNEIENFLQTATVVLTQQFIAVHANHGSCADVSGCTIPYRLLADRGREVQTCVLLGIQNRLLADFQLLGVFRSAQRFIVTRLESDVPNSFIEPLRFACIPFAEINEFLVLIFLEGFLRRIADKVIWVLHSGTNGSGGRNGGVGSGHCVGRHGIYSPFLCVETQKRRTSCD